MFDQQLAGALAVPVPGPRLQVHQRLHRPEDLVQLGRGEHGQQPAQETQEAQDAPPAATDAPPADAAPGATPGGRLSLQKHFHRAEHWVVVKGTAEVTLNESVVLVHENEAIYLPIGSMHRLTNPGRIPLELIEVQVGSYTGEDDIIRVEDIYGR